MLGVWVWGPSRREPWGTKGPLLRRSGCYQVVADVKEPPSRAEPQPPAPGARPRLRPRAAPGCGIRGQIRRRSVLATQMSWIGKWGWGEETDPAIPEGGSARRWGLRRAPLGSSTGRAGGIGGQLGSLLQLPGCPGGSHGAEAPGARALHPPGTAPLSAQRCGAQLASSLLAPCAPAPACWSWDCPRLLAKNLSGRAEIRADFAPVMSVLCPDGSAGTLAPCPSLAHFLSGSSASSPSAQPGTLRDCDVSIVSALKVKGTNCTGHCVNRSGK